MKTNLINKHDYLTLTVTDSEKRRANLTMARHREKLTGSGKWDQATFKALADSWFHQASPPRGNPEGSARMFGEKNIGDFMARLKTMADSSPDFQTLATRMRG